MLEPWYQHGTCNNYNSVLSLLNLILDVTQVRIGFSPLVIMVL